MPKPSKRTPPTVAVIGCGPGGMFFLHAIETRRRQMQADGDKEGLASLPIAICFEKSPEPGGVWRAKRGESDSTNMYEALWTNGPKEGIEFFDYHFDDHFHRPLPVYMPRQPLLEYMLCRVTRNCPHFFDSVRFNTSVTSVTYNEEAEKFIIASHDFETGKDTTEEFDKCIWAAGENGKPKIPTFISDLLESGGFKGKAMHSSATENFETDVKGKRVVFLGDSYSAEDLALQAVKLGVEKVYICSRSGEGVASYMGAWPMDKVEVLNESMPFDVIQDGNGLRVRQIEYDCETYEYNVVEDGKSKDLLDISTVVYCTGYKPNTSMLQKDLRSPFEKKELPGEFPEGWTMKPNALTEVFGDVPPYEELEAPQTFLPKLYRNVLISNPNMMYIHESSYDPLLEIDVCCWLCLSYITGDVELPIQEEMHRRNLTQLMDEMDIPYLRYMIDQNYWTEWGNLPSDHWGNDTNDPRLIEMERENNRFHLRLIARDMRDAGYPSDLGTYEELNDRGEALAEMNYISDRARSSLDPKSEDKDWRTFRDHDPSANHSIFTGTRAVPLKKRWLELDEEDCGITDYVDAPTPIPKKKECSSPSSPSSSISSAHGAEHISLLDRGSSFLSEKSVELDLDGMSDSPLTVATDISSSES